MSRISSSRRATALLCVACAMLLGLATVATSASADPAPGDSTTTIPGSSVPSTSTSTPGVAVPDGVTTTTLAGPPATSGPGGFGGPQPVDPNAPPEPPMPDPSPQVRVLLAQLELQAQEKARDEATFKRDLVRATERTVEFEVLGAAQKVEQAKALVVQSDRRLRDDALAMYVNPSKAGFENLVTAQTDEESTRTVLLSVTIKNEKSARRDAEALVEMRQRAVAAKQAELGAAKLRTASYQAVVDAQVAVVADKRSELREATKLSPDWSLPIQGDSVFTPPELAAWFTQHGVASRAQAPIAQLAQAYIVEGADEHIRGDMAFAQSVLETGSFTNDDTIRFNNFAGVGHCDSCATGFQFATPDLGVRAQIQLLKDYSERGAVLKNPLVDSRLHGPSGCCQDWRALTHTWATNGNYGAKIMGVYRDMLAWLVTERGLRPLVES